MDITTTANVDLVTTTQADQPGNRLNNSSVLTLITNMLNRKRETRTQSGSRKKTEPPSKCRHTKKWRAYKSLPFSTWVHWCSARLLAWENKEAPASSSRCAIQALAIQSNQGKILTCRSALAGAASTADPHNTLRAFRVATVMRKLCDISTVVTCRWWRRIEEPVCLWLWQMHDVCTRCIVAALFTQIQLRQRLWI